MSQNHFFVKAGIKFHLRAKCTQRVPQPDFRKMKLVMKAPYTVFHFLKLE